MLFRDMITISVKTQSN